MENFNQLGYNRYVYRCIVEYRLQERAEQLAQRERALQQREAALARQRLELQTAQAAMERQARGDACALLEQINAEMHGAYQTLQALAKPMNEARQLCSGEFLAEELRQLCRITRAMHQSGEPSMALYADELDAVLQRFGCVPIVPRPGQPMDYLEMTKLDAAQAGETVDAVRSTGWKLNDRVLEKAVVTVKEEA